MSQPVLIVRTTGEESHRNASDLARTIERGGYRPKILAYWLDDEHTGTCPGWAMPPLLRSQIADAPRLSDFAFQSIHGFRLNLPELMSHSYGVGELRPDTLLPESPWAQHLRGVAHCFSQTLQETQPACVLVPNGAEVISTIIAEVCSRNSIKFLYWESPFFSGYHFVDPYSPHFYPGQGLIDKAWPPAISAAHSLDATKAFIQHFVSERRSKYEQTSELAQIARLENWVAVDRRPIVFIPQQIPTDANVVVNLGDYDDYEASLQAAISSIPSGWRLLTKSHPKGGLRRQIQMPDQDYFDANGIAIHDIFERVSVVATMSSNVGLEALMYDLPVAVWGQPVYARKGCATELGDPSDLGAYLSGPLSALNRLNRDALIRHVLETGLVRHGDGDRFRELLGLATSAPRSFAQFYPERIRNISNAARALEVELKVEPRLESALSKLDDAHRELVQAAAGPSLFEHSYGGAVCSYQDGVIWPNYRALFSSWTARKLISYKKNLQNHHSPDEVLRRLCEACSASNLVSLEVKMPSDETEYVQKLDICDIVSIVNRIDPRIHVEVRARHGRELEQDLVGASDVVILLRRKRGLLEPIISRLVSRRLRSTLRYDAALLEAALFSSDCGRSPNGSEIWITGPISGRHVIYGPYRSLPAGKWRAQMFLSSKSNASATEWTFDVLLNGETVAAVEWLCQGNARPPALEFNSAVAGELELRIWCHQLDRGDTFVFQGAELHDVTG